MSTYCKSFVFCLTLFLTLASSNARGQAALLLEEPYSYDGTFAGTGHSAVYLTRVCAETPFELRHCGPGEQGVVISRYHGIAGHDWIAVPLVPYFFIPHATSALPWSAGVTMAALLVFGLLKGRAAGISPVQSAVQTVIVGGLAAAAAFALARAFS